MEVGQATKEEAKQCLFTLKVSPVPVAKWTSSGPALEKASRRSFQADRGLRRIAVSGKAMEESATESPSEEETKHVSCPRGERAGRKERHVKTKAKKKASIDGHSLAVRSRERKKGTLSASQSRNSTSSISETDSDSSFDLPKVRTHCLVSRKQPSAKTMQRKSLAQMEDTGRRMQPRKTAGIEQNLDDASDFHLTKEELAEFDVFGATSEEDDVCKGKASYRRVDRAPASTQALEEQGAGWRVACDKTPAGVSHRARVSNPVLFSSEDDKELEHEDPLLPLATENTHTTSLPDASGGQPRAQLGKGRGGIGLSSLVASYYCEDVAQKARNSMPTLSKHESASHEADSCHMITVGKEEAAVDLPPPIPSIVAPRAPVTVEPSEPQGLGTTHREGGSYPAVETQETLRRNDTVTSDASCSLPLVQPKPEVTPTSGPGSVEAALTVPAPEGGASSGQQKVTQGDSDMSSDDNDIAVNPLEGLLSDKLKLQKKQPVSTRTVQGTQGGGLCSALWC